jgi:hypothetical protein
VLYLEKAGHVKEKFLNGPSIRKNLRETSTEACSASGLVIHWGTCTMTQHLARTRVRKYIS